MKADGGPAFPKYFGGNRDLAPGEESGMSLRDWFAGQALNTIGITMRIQKTDAGMDAIAELAYRMADALLAERAK